MSSINVIVDFCFHSENNFGFYWFVYIRNQNEFIPIQLSLLSIVYKVQTESVN